MSVLKSDRGANPLLVEDVFDAPAARVFRAWTEPNELIRWFGRPPTLASSAEIDLRVGGNWRISFGPTEQPTSCFEGAYDEIIRDSKLVFTWSHVDFRADGGPSTTPPSRVTIMFDEEQNGARTRISLRHEDISTEAGRRGVGAGWIESFASLKAVLDT